MILIAGAGVSGLTVARHLPGDGEYLVLEKNDYIGGLATQYKAGNYWFDFAGHYFHFLHKAEIKTLVERACTFREFNRKSKTYAAGRFIPFPIQFHLSYLPAHIRKRIVEEIENNHPSDADNLHDFLSSNFGETLYQLFFRPFLSKYYNTPTTEIIATMDKGSIPPPDKERITAGASGKRFFNAGYNPVFYYPSTSLRHFITQYSADIPADKMHLNEEILEVDVLKKRVTTTAGQYDYDKLVTSMPLNRLLQIIKPADIFPSHKELHYVSTLLVNAVLKRKRKRFHWVYLADESIPFYRVGFYPVHKHAACYLERSITPGSPPPDKAQVRREVEYTLKRLQLIDSAEELEFCDIRVIPVSYILFTKNWRSVVPGLLEKLETYGIHSIGRYGGWNYTSMSDDIKTALQCVPKLHA
ncbi:MAG: NAD(P)-binding protein [bacterium]|nr:NAD(P)-binding protein [bacterium]